MATDLYRPYGEQVETVISLATKETKGFIGERYDTDAGLSYLNARYYDPRLGLFLQPDWWEVMKPGVGTNRYSYSFNDPVNGKDPTGHQAQHGPTDRSPSKSVWGGPRGAFLGHINKGDPGYGDNFESSGTLPSHWIDVKNVLSGQAGGLGEELNAQPGVKSPFGPTPGPLTLTFANPKTMESNTALGILMNDKLFRGLALSLINHSITPKGKYVETGGMIYVNTKTKGWEFQLSLGAATAHSLIVSGVRAPKANETMVTIHTHPMSGLPMRFDLPEPSPTDLKSKYPGVVVDRIHQVWGYHDGGF